MKYSNNSKQVIKERSREVRGRKGIDGIAANAMKVPKNTLLMGADARRRAKNMTVNEESLPSRTRSRSYETMQRMPYSSVYPLHPL